MARGAHKSGPRDVMEASRGTSPAGNSGGGPGRSEAQKKIPGPEHPGQPIAMRKALRKKPVHGTATGAAGTLR